MKYLLYVISFWFSQQTLADVTVTGTRIIYPAQQKNVTIQLNNQADRPALIQAWIDDGDASKIPEAGKIPFILTPPVVEIPANQGQMLRLIKYGAESLAHDRETIYWFNLLDIPPVTAEQENQNHLSISVRSRIKIFYRPEKLIMTQAKAFNSIKAKYIGKNKSISLENPSPYFINILNLDLKQGSNHSQLNEFVMLEPFSNQEISIKSEVIPDHLNLKIINDYGGTEIYHIKVE